MSTLVWGGPHGGSVGLPVSSEEPRHKLASFWNDKNSVGWPSGRLWCQKKCSLSYCVSDHFFSARGFSVLLHHLTLTHQGVKETI
jgi:hypothetical protein